MSLFCGMGNVVKNEYAMFAASRRAGKLGAAMTGKKAPVIQAKYIQRQVGTTPMVGMVAGTFIPIPGGCILGYITGRVLSGLAKIIK